MSSKQDILNAIRDRQPDQSPPQPPSLEEVWTRFDDPKARFAEVLPTVGGQCHVVSSPREAAEHLAQQPTFRSADRILSTVEDCVASNVQLDAIDDPHQLEDVDYGVFEGQFAVAENGAVWVTDDSLRHRVVYFIVQHLVLLVPADQIIHHMHEAYERLQFREAGFGVFISGPSKTADIEQSLVIGAHGPRSLIVYLVEN